MNRLPCPRFDYGLRPTLNVNGGSPRFDDGLRPTLNVNGGSPRFDDGLRPTLNVNGGCSRFGWPLRLLASALLAGCNVAVGSQQGYEPAQPVAYSHAQHAGEYKIACLYCHFGAERSRHAGVPPVQVCMNCHAQVKKDAPEIQKLVQALDGGTPIQWTKVHRLPDHAYLNHASHVAAGVKCQQCHGPVESMVRVAQVETMAMGWCLDCHRTTAAAPENAGRLAPPTDCSACHR